MAMCLVPKWCNPRTLGLKHWWRVTKRDLKALSIKVCRPGFLNISCLLLVAVASPLHLRLAFF